MIYIYIAIYLIGCYLSFKGFIWDMTEDHNIDIGGLPIIIFVTIFSWMGVFAFVNMRLSKLIAKKYENKVIFKKRVKK